MASINLGVVGCIAASAAGSPPTAVSIAQAASTGQNNAFATVDANSVDIMDVGYSEWTAISGSTLTYDVAFSDLQDFNDFDATANLDTFAYLRATGATSFSWSGAVHASSLTYGSAAVSGSGSSNQDSTSGSGCGIKFQLVGQSGRGGYLYAANGDYVTYKLTGTATNSDGSTSATLYLKYNFTG